MREGLALYLPWIWFISGMAWIFWLFRDEWFAFVWPLFLIPIGILGEKVISWF